VRAAAQQLIDVKNAGLSEKKHLPDVETTRNTIFPASFARRNPQPADLAAYYRERYTKDGLRGFPGNDRGTYFGRIVAYPRGDDDPGDQLTDTVRKLLDEVRGGSPKSSRYEINIYSEAHDTNPMSFPCLAHLSVHLHEGRLHMQAIYRNELLVARGYGNFLGLAELQRYIAAAAAVDLGELLMTIGHAELDAPKRDVQRLLDQFEDKEEPDSDA
jgi:thymidylate synthase